MGARGGLDDGEREPTSGSEGGGAVTGVLEDDDRAPLDGSAGAGATRGAR